MLCGASNLDLRLHRSTRASNSISRIRIRCISQFSGSKLNCRPWKLAHRSVQVHVIDESYTNFHSLNEDDHDIISSDLNLPYSSEGGDSDNSDDDDDYMHLYPYNNVDLNTPYEKNDKKDHLQLLPDDASFPMAAHNLYAYGHKRKRRRVREGIFLTLYLITFILIFLLYFDSFSWKIIRLPLEPYFLTKPFIISIATSALSGLFYTPLLNHFNIYQIMKKPGEDVKFSKRVVPTMGGLFFVPIGIIVARVLIGENNNDSLSYNMAVFVTLSFGAIGLFDNILRGIGRNYELYGWLKVILQMAVGSVFSYWLGSAIMSTPYKMKYLVPMPRPIGLLNLGNLYYLIITQFCFTAIGNGVSVTDGVAGLAGGIAALSFLGMSIAVLPLSPELSIFGASMCGSCIGFLFHNRYKSSVLMGEIGLLSIGGALVSMASITGMFFPLFICTSLFSLEFFSAFLQVLYYKFLQKNYGLRKLLQKNYGLRKLFLHKAQVHRKLKLFGFKDPLIVGGSYFISYLLALLAGYVGLISA